LAFEKLNSVSGDGPPVANELETTIATASEAPIRARVLIPNERPAGLIVYFHGGGWVLGGIETCSAVGAHIATLTGCAVALIEYRLAPEHRFPAAVLDADAAVAWGAEEAARLAGPAAPVLVAGDSAGATLATVAVRRARDAAGPQVAMQLLICPALDGAMDTASYADPENDLRFSRATMEWFWDHYVPDPTVRLGPDASPLRASDLAGLPPAVIVTAEHDVLRDEGERYAERLAAAGVPVWHRRFDGQMHVFATFPGVLPAALPAIEFLAEQVRSQIGGACGANV